MYTAKDLEQIDRDIAQLHQGRRVATVIYGDHHVHYADVRLADLLALRQRMRLELQMTELCAKRRLIFATSKGLGLF